MAMQGQQHPAKIVACCSCADESPSTVMTQRFDLPPAVQCENLSLDEALVACPASASLPQSEPHPLFDTLASGI